MSGEGTVCSLRLTGRVGVVVVVAVAVEVAVVVGVVGFSKQRNRVSTIYPS